MNSQGKNSPARCSRRQFMRLLAAAGAASLLPPFAGAAGANAPITRTIPSSGQALPMIGLGTWITFNVGDDPAARKSRTDVMRHFFEAGGSVIDSSPMYGSSQAVVGHGLDQLGKTNRVFSADKVWTPFFGAATRDQIKESLGDWKVPRFDLMQVHNIVDWRDHLPVLFEMRQAGTVGYVGITTSEGRRHGEFEKIMREQPLDFIQISYNIVNRVAEKRLLPTARDRGMGVIVNRPFQQSKLIDWAKRHPLPDWAAEIDCANWAQFLLKFIVSHPDVTCAIPATTRVDHVRENMGAMTGRLPDAAMRRRMAAYVEDL